MEELLIKKLPDLIKKIGRESLTGSIVINQEVNLFFYKGTFASSFNDNTKLLQELLEYVSKCGLIDDDFVLGLDLNQFDKKTAFANIRTFLGNFNKEAEEHIIKFLKVRELNNLTFIVKNYSNYDPIFAPIDEEAIIQNDKNLFSIPQLVMHIEDSYSLFANLKLIFDDLEYNELYIATESKPKEELNELQKLIFQSSEKGIQIKSLLNDLLHPIINIYQEILNLLDKDLIMILEDAEDANASAASSSQTIPPSYLSSNSVPNAPASALGLDMNDFKLQEEEPAEFSSGSKYMVLKVDDDVQHDSSRVKVPTSEVDITKGDTHHGLPSVNLDDTVNAFSSRKPKVADYSELYSDSLSSYKNSSYKYFKTSFIYDLKYNLISKMAVANITDILSKLLLFAFLVIVINIFRAIYTLL